MQTEVIATGSTALPEINTLWRDRIPSLEDKIRDILSIQATRPILQASPLLSPMEETLRLKLDDTTANPQMLAQIIAINIEGSEEDLAVVAQRLANNYGRSIDFWLQQIPKLVVKKQYKHCQKQIWEAKSSDLLSICQNFKELQHFKRIFNAKQKAYLSYSKLIKIINSNSLDSGKISQLYVASQKSLEKLRILNQGVQIKRGRKKQIKPKCQQQQPKHQQQRTKEDENVSPIVASQKPRKKRKVQIKQIQKKNPVPLEHQKDATQPDSAKKDATQSESAKKQSKLKKEQQKKKIVSPSKNLLSFWKPKPVEIVVQEVKQDQKPKTIINNTQRKLFSTLGAKQIRQWTEERQLHFQSCLISIALGQQNNVDAKIQFEKIKPRAVSSRSLFFQRIFRKNIKPDDRFIRYAARQTEQFDPELDYDKGMQTEIEEMEAESIGSAQQEEQADEEEEAEGEQEGFIVEDGYVSNDEGQQDDQDSEQSFKPQCKQITGAWYFPGQQQLQLIQRFAAIRVDQSLDVIDFTVPEEKKWELEPQIKRQLALLFLGSSQHKDTLVNKAKEKYPEVQKGQFLKFIREYFVKGKRKMKIMDLTVFLQFGSQEEYNSIMQTRLAQCEANCLRRRQERRARKAEQQARGVEINPI